MSTDSVLRSFEFTDEDFRVISDIAYNDFGLYLRENKKALIYSRLVGRIRRLGLKTFSDYCSVLKSSQCDPERSRLLSLLTTNVTRFFREEHHFTYLKETVWPRLAEAAKNGKTVRIWSAGCSTGQEPYSLAMSLLDALSGAGPDNFRLFASDVDGEVLEKAQLGLYREDSLTGLSEHHQKKYFEKKEGGSFAVASHLRSMVEFRQVNLMESWPFQEPFDIIFCRNVAIYFDADTQSRLWMRFADLLKPGGHLSIGHSERVSGPAQGLLRSIGQTSYTRTNGASTPLKRIEK